MICKESSARITERCAITWGTDLEPLRRQHTTKASHLVDRALNWARHTTGPGAITQAALRRSLPRRLRPDKAVISKLVTLGRALASVPARELDFYRSPRVTYKLVQRVARRGPSAHEIRSELRAAIVSPPVDGRTRGRRGYPRNQGAPASYHYYWDPARAVADPELAVAHYLAFATALHRNVAATIRRAAALQLQTSPRFNEQSLAMLKRTLAQYRRDRATLGAPAATLLPASTQRTIGALETLGRALLAAAEALDLRPPGDAPHQRIPRPAAVPLVPTDADLDADLSD